MKRKLPTDADLSANRSLVAEVDVPKYSVNRLVRLFRQILSQPNIQAILFEAGKPVKVTYYGHPLEPELEERLAQDITVKELLDRVTVKPVQGYDNIFEDIARTMCAMQQDGLEASHFIVPSKEAADTALGCFYDGCETFLGMQLLEHADLPESLFLVCGAATAVAGPAEIQAIYGVTK